MFWMGIAFANKEDRILLANTSGVWFCQALMALRIGTLHRIDRCVCLVVQRRQTTKLALGLSC